VRVSELDFLTRRTVLPTRKTTNICGCAVGVLFVVIGVLVYLASADTKQFRVEYTCSDHESAEVELDVKEEMKQPVFLYFELDGFYLTHKNVKQSVSYPQMVSDVPVVDGDCKPMMYFGDMVPPYPWDLINPDFAAGSNSTRPANVSDDTPIKPCGSLAYWISTDRFSLKSVDTNVSIPVSENDIVWQKLPYKNTGTGREFPRVEQGQLLWWDVEDEHFKAWIASRSYHHFAQLWGRIEENIPAGKYIVSVSNCRQLWADKAVFLATHSWIGASNLFVANAYLVTGVVLMLWPLVNVVLGKIVEHHRAKRALTAVANAPVGGAGTKLPETDCVVPVEQPPS